MRPLLRASGCLVHMKKFGGDIYSSSVTVMCEMIHKDPTCYDALDEAGLPDAFLSSVKAGVLPSSKALACVSNGLGAICLNAKGLEVVRETSALSFLSEFLTEKKYVLLMNDAIVPLANAVKELMRHVSSLRGTGVDLIVEIINKIALIADSKDSTSKGVSDEQFIQLCIFHVMVLIHRTMENAKTCRLFVEKAGIEALLKLLLRPSITPDARVFPSLFLVEFLMFL
nr:E3 ubiquitin-protein ligase UPL2-like [Tanacetum cinerariifolium]